MSRAQVTCEDIYSRDAVSFFDSLIVDFLIRDSLPETSLPLENRPEWGEWGPWPNRFPSAEIPNGLDPVVWSRYRVEAVAKKYIGLPYRHRHIPSLGGLDCSNYTAWVYNYGLGIPIRSNIKIQSEEAGRLLEKGEGFQKGDLLFSWNKAGTRISHVVIFLAEGWVIDAAGGGVQVRPWQGWRRKNFAWARRIIE